MKMQGKQQQFQGEMQLAIAKLMKDAELQQAKIHKLEAEAILAVEQAGGVRTGHEIAMIDAQIGAAKAKHEGIQDSMQTIMNLEKHMKDMTAPTE
jgi:hypothetical protein